VISVSNKPFTVAWHARGKPYSVVLSFRGDGEYTPVGHALSLHLSVVRANVPQCSGPFGSNIYLGGRDAELLVCGTSVVFAIPQRATDWVKQA
jgi:hypothetical protein